MKNRNLILAARLLIMSFTGAGCFADTNCDGSINIVDALLGAQYYVGLISRFW